MGQNQGKERANTAQKPAPRPQQGGRGVRTSGYSDALVSPHHPQHATGDANPQQQAASTPTSGDRSPKAATGNPSTQSLPRQESAVESERGGEDSAATASQPPQETHLVPIVVRYKDPGRIKTLLESKAPVLLSTEYEGWRNTIPMCPSEDSYYCIAKLPVGEQRVRFLIDQEPFLDSSQPSTTEGIPANTVTVSEVLLETRDDDDIIGGGPEDGKDWGQEEIAFEETRKYPPMLPPHLRYTPLNTPPTQVRCAPDGILNVADETMLLDPEHLPLPLSVTINHVYLQRREDHTVLGMTTRYGNKFTTVVYYKSIPSAA